MARYFNNGTYEYLSYPSPVVVTPPFSFACWFNSISITKGQVLISVSTATVAIGEYYVLMLSGNVGGDPVSAAVFDNGVYTGGADTSVGFSANTWQHGCAVFATTTDRRVFLNGGSKGTDANFANPSISDWTSIGVLNRDDNPGSSMDGAIAEAVIYDVVLSDAEAAMLALGYSPLLIRPQSIVTYVPLIRDNDEDIVGGLSFIAVNTPTISEHPRVFNIAPPSISSLAAAVASSPYGPPLQVI